MYLNSLTQALAVGPDRLRGLSEQLMRSHFDNNYLGAVKRLHGIREHLAATAPESRTGFALNGLKREELIAANSASLHELYFASLGADETEMEGAMQLALAANFGSVPQWRQEFVAMGKAQAGGSGWVLLMFQPRDGSLVNQWAADHSHALVGAVPLLALDMYEHAYHIDFAANAGAYVEAFMDNIRWSAVYARYQRAVHAASEDLGVHADQTQTAVVLDVRRAAVYQAARSRIAGAEWRDPATVAQWAPTLPKDRTIVVSCVYGHEVSRATAMRLRALGLDAWFLQGGMDGWVAAGLPVQALG